MSPLSVCRIRHSDGLDLATLCDGVSHYRAVLPESDEENVRVSVERLHPCIGCCRPNEVGDEIRRFVKQWGEYAYVHIEPDAQVYVQGRVSVVAVAWKSWYTKRNSEGTSYCLGDVHLSVGVRHDHLCGCDSGYEHTVTVRVAPCDHVEYFASLIRPPLADAIARAYEALAPA